MDPRSNPPPMMAQTGSAATPSRASSTPPRWPRVQEHLVQPEVTRDEMIRGRKVEAMPAKPPHADQQSRLDYLLNAHVQPGYVVSAELLTRMGEKSDFATDVCIRKEGDDPETGVRYLEEVAWEVVSEQSLKDITEKAEDMSARGVRRILAVFVKAGKVKEWRGGWQEVEQIDDPTLARPLPVAAILEAAAVDDAVAWALLAKGNRVLAEREAEVRRASMDQGKRLGLDEGKREATQEAILDLCELLGLRLTETQKASLFAMDLTELVSLRHHLRQARTWPAS